MYYVKEIFDTGDGNECQEIEMQRHFEFFNEICNNRTDGSFQNF